jgi:hypothetical protein
MQSEIHAYAGLFWGAIVQGEIHEPFLDFLSDAGAAVQLSRFPYQTWRLESGDLCIGLPLAGVPPIPDGLVASSQATRSIPAPWIADRHLEGVRRDFLALQQVSAQHGFSLPPGEPLLVSPYRNAGPVDLGHGRGVARGSMLLECLQALEELDVSLMAVRVPDEWGLDSPYWTPGHLIEVITGGIYGGASALPLGDYGDAPACIVLVQDAVQGIFAEILCKCAEGEDTLTRLLVVDVLANTEARDWLCARRHPRWLELTLSVVTGGLLNW